MNVQVVHLLPSLRPSVAHHAETTLGIGAATLLDGESGCQDHHSTEQGLMRWEELSHRRDMHLGHHEEVHRCPWMDVVKGKDFFVFMNFRRRDVPSNDFAENAVGVVHEPGVFQDCMVRICRDVMN